MGVGRCIVTKGVLRMQARRCSIRKDFDEDIEGIIGEECTDYKLIIAKVFDVMYMLYGLFML